MTDTIVIVRRWVDCRRNGVGSHMENANYNNSFILMFYPSVHFVYLLIQHALAEKKGTRSHFIVPD